MFPSASVKVPLLEYGAALGYWLICCRHFETTYRGADKSFARPTTRCVLFDGENISFGASLAMCVCVCVCVNI